MDAELTIKNYRCFPDTRPARIVVKDGFTAFLGVNNSGKSSLLKFFYELRELFNALSVADNNLVGALRHSPRGFQLPPSIADTSELFYKGNGRNLVIEFKLTGVEDGLHPIPVRFTATVLRPTNTFELKTFLPGAVEYEERGLSFTGSILRIDHTISADFGPFLDLCRDLASTLYIGPFRNAINVGTKSPYFDIGVGQSFIQTWRQLKTGNSRELNEVIYNLTEDIRSIFDFQRLEINASPDDQNLQFFVNGRSYSLGELGSGLAQFVLVLTNVATKKPAFILIDEPELNLHPSLQLDFLTTLGSYAKRGVLFATHSYGLARAHSVLGPFFDAL